MDFTNISSLNNFPFFVPFNVNADGFWIPGGLSGACLAVYTGNSTLTIAANQTTDNTHKFQGVGRGMMRNVYTTGSDANQRGFCFNDVTAYGSASLHGMDFYRWGTSDARLMTLDISGGLQIKGQVTCSGITSSLYGTSSNAITASYVLGGATIKAGILSASAFSGSPFSASVTFANAFPNTLYSTVVTGDASRTWTIQQKSGSGFYINSNSSTPMTGSTYWQAVGIGEFNY